MFSLTILGSGSAGNCALVETEKCRVLIDGGFSARQITQRLAVAGVDPCDLDGILITHEHCDHVLGLDVLCRRHEIPVFINSGTMEAIAREEQCAAAKKRKDWRIFQTGACFSIGDIDVQTFSIPHDAADPTGFVLAHDGTKLGFVTDLGYATRLVMERLREVHTLVIETNHDERLLQEDKRRPWPVKQRIMSRHGHLSNAAAAAAVQALLHADLRRVVMGHLSRDCNSPELATVAMRQPLEGCGAAHVEVFCAAQSEPSPRFAI